MNEAFLKFFGFINFIFITLLTLTIVFEQSIFSNFDISFENLVSCIALVSLNGTLAVLWFSKQNKKMLKNWLTEE